MRTALYLLIVGVLVIAGCETAPEMPPRREPASPQAANPPLLTGPLAYVNGRTISEADLLTPLIEADAGQVLSEIVIDAMIERQLGERGLAVDAAAVDAERRLVLATLADDEDDAMRLLGRFRRQRGLGEQRYESFLRRNAGLRLLVADRVQINPTALRQEYDLVYGPRYQPRIIVAGTASDASRLRRRVTEDGESFAAAAAAASTDPSAAQGGLLSPISPADTTYPQVIRDALRRMEVGQVSDVIAIEGGFAILKLERLIDPQPTTFDQARADLETSLRRRQEQLLMRQLAAEMIASSEVVVLNEALDKGWQYRRQLLLNEGREP
jgi:parvulin-like peptidyl-prolyl isomerase